MRALNQMTTWNVKTVIPGHGSPGTPETLRAQSAFIDDLWKQVSAGDAGKTPEQYVQVLNLRPLMAISLRTRNRTLPPSGTFTRRPRV